MDTGQTNVHCTQFLVFINKKCQSLALPSHQRDACSHGSAVRQWNSQDHRSDPGSKFPQEFISCLFQNLGHISRTIFFILMQIRWKFHSVVFPAVFVRSLLRIVHGTTAVLSWHEQHFVAKRYRSMKLNSDRLSVDFELQWKIIRDIDHSFSFWLSPTVS